MLGESSEQKHRQKFVSCKIAATGGNYNEDIISDLISIEEVRNLPELGSLRLSSLDVKVIIDQSKILKENKIIIISQGYQRFIKKSDFLTALKALQERGYYTSLKATELRKYSQLITSYVKKSSVWSIGDLILNADTKESKQLMATLFKQFRFLLQKELEKKQNKQKENPNQNLNSEIAIVTSILNLEEKDIQVKLAELNEAYKKMEE